MIEISKRNLVLVCLVCLAVGWWNSSGSSPIPRPGPFGPPAPDRPVLRWIARAAKNLLWIAIVADPPPVQPQHLVRAQVGADGYQELEHTRGW